MGNITNVKGYITNPSFSSGEAIIPLSGSDFAYANNGYNGIYVGTAGNLTVKTVTGDVITLVSASGFISGIIGAVSSSSTAANIVGFDKQPIAPPTTTTTTVAPTTSTTTAAVVGVAAIINSGSYDGTPGSNPTITGGGYACFNTFNNLGGITLYFTSASLASWSGTSTPSLQGYTDIGLTTLYTGAGYGDLNAWGLSAAQGGATPPTVRFFDQATDAFIFPKVCGS